MSNKKSLFQPDFTTYQEVTFYEELNLSGNEKQREKFIKTVEAHIRTSIEYKNYIKYLKTEALLTQCSILNKLPEELSRSLTIEMHHHPYTLYDLVDIVLTRNIRLAKSFTRLSIADEVMYLHYKGLVGIVPLTKTMHQLAHNNRNIIHKSLVYGNYGEFKKLYEIYMTNDQIERFNAIEKLSETLAYNHIKNYLELDDNLLVEYDDKDYPTVEVKEVEANKKLDKLSSIKEIMEASKEESKLKAKKKGEDDE